MSLNINTHHRKLEANSILQAFGLIRSFAIPSVKRLFVIKDYSHSYTIIAF
jgi:hypothetical protein